MDEIMKLMSKVKMTAGRSDKNNSIKKEKNIKS